MVVTSLRIHLWYAGHGRATTRLGWSPSWSDGSWCPSSRCMSLLSPALSLSHSSCVVSTLIHTPMTPFSRIGVIVTRLYPTFSSLVCRYIHFPSSLVSFFCRVFFPTLFIFTGADATVIYTTPGMVAFVFDVFYMVVWLRSFSIIFSPSPCVFRTTISPDKIHIIS